jgi:hypothetical protein
MEVRRSAVAASIAALVVLVGLVGFLLGRESGRASAIGAPPGPAPVAPPAAPAPNAAPALDAGANAEAQAVGRYFAQVAAIQSDGPSGDATDFATRLLGSAMSGDPSGFDGLLRSARDGAVRARRLDVPAPCAGYHQRMLALLDDGATLLVALRAALESQDAEALATIGVKATGLQARTEALVHEERTIKARFGLP